MGFIMQTQLSTVTTSPVYIPGLAISALARDLQIDAKDIIK